MRLLLARPDAEAVGDADAFLDYLAERLRLDLGSYRRASLLRSIQRRMSCAGITNFEAYRDHIAADAREFARLRESILVHWTWFGRNPTDWNCLHGHLRSALIEKPANEPFRVWSAGCSTGEETYTLAIVLAEILGMGDFRSRVRIFGTDVSASAVGVARAGVYRKERSEGFANLHTKYFDIQGDWVRLKRTLRHGIVFARHDLLNDPPLGGMDLVLCRNTILHFTRAAQQVALARLFLALRPESMMLVGAAESAYLSEFFEGACDQCNLRRALPGRWLRVRALSLASLTRVSHSRLSLASLSLSLSLSLSRPFETALAWHSQSSGYDTAPHSALRPLSARARQSGDT
jgi:chemotaxis methyl-accepting protein methylase